MTDKLTSQRRSYNMSRIKSKNTSPEILVRKFLYANGLRYRLHSKLLPGKPDIVLTRFKTAIFVHGCFWHSHSGCKYSNKPKTNSDYWLPKLERNTARDKANFLELQVLGWNIIIVWECELKKAIRAKTLDTLRDDIIHSLHHVQMKPHL
jgi:DNA mismatch endonuclease (patch repair protein)